MKKLLSIVLVLTFVISLTSCGNAFDNAVEEMKEYGFNVAPSGPISCSNLEDQTGIKFTGKILRHFSCIDYDEKTHMIVNLLANEFEHKSDARAIYNYVKERGLYAQIKGNVVVWGTMEVIEDLNL